MTLMDAPPSAPVVRSSVAPPSAVVRLRLFAVCLGLTLLAFMQEPAAGIGNTELKAGSDTDCHACQDTAPGCAFDTDTILIDLGEGPQQ